MKNNKGITLTSLVIYIAVVFVITAVVIRVTTHFTGNMSDVADTSFETEFNKLNLYLLNESKEQGNKIQEITDGLQVKFTSGNKYTYNEAEKIVYLNEGIKICENIEECEFSKKTAENGKEVLILKITIGETTKTAEYVMRAMGAQDGGVDIDDYLIGVSKVTYYLKAGDYVDYTPTTGTYKVADGQYGSGYTTDKGYQEFTTEEDNESTTEVDESLKWRVFSIDEQTGEIELVSATAAQSTTPLYLQGADGYNHGVDILNDLCETLYSKTEDGKTVATARSINVEDINSKTTYDYEKFTNGTFTYGEEIKLSNYETNARKYPNLYAKEDGFYVGGKKQEGGISVSEGLNDGVINNGITSYSTVTGFTDDWDSNTNSMKKDVSITYTGYEYYPENGYINNKLGINILPIELIKCENNYWMSSRLVFFGGTHMVFAMRVFHTGMVTKNYTSNIREPSGSATAYSVRPIVTLDATQLIDFTVGDGSEENPWGMK